MFLNVVDVEVFDRLHTIKPPSLQDLLQLALHLILVSRSPFVLAQFDLGKWP
jgi:hypothetical protein